MTRARIALVFVTAAALMALGVGLLLLRGSGGAASDRAVYEFGEAVEGDTIVHTFALANDGADTLRLEEVSARASQVDVGDSVIPPGAIGRITVRLPTARTRGAVIEVVRVQMAGEDRPRWLRLRGHVVPPVQVAPQDRVYFFTVVGVGPTQELQLINHREPPLRILGVSSDNPLFRVRSAAVTAGRRYGLTVALDSAAPAGRHEGRITVRTDHPAYAGIDIAALALVRNVVSASLSNIGFSRLNYEALDREAVSQRTVLVEKHQGTDFDVPRAAVDLPFMEVRIVPQKPGTSYLVHVRIRQKDAPRGPFAGTLRIETNDPAFPQLTLPVHGEIL